MRVFGELTACIYGGDVPTNIQTVILRYPVRALGLITQRKELPLNNQEVARLMDKLSDDLEDPNDSMSFDCQGAFWIGYYQYTKLSDDVQKYGANELAILGETLYGNQWQTDLAKALQLSSSRRIRAWLTGERPIPIGVWADIADLLRERQMTIQNALKILK